MGFRRQLRAWEEDEVKRLYVWLNEVPINSGHLDDCLRWELNSSGQFTVAAVWKWFQAAMGPDLCITRWLWKAVAPPKIQFFGWLA